MAMEMATNDIGFEFIKKIALEPGDVIVIKINTPVGTEEIKESIKRWFTTVFPHHKLIVLAAGEEISVISMPVQGNVEIRGEHES